MTYIIKTNIMTGDIERQKFLAECEAENFKKFKTEFKDLLFKKFGITMDDCTDEQQLIAEFKDGSTVDSFIDWLGDKYDLTLNN